MERKAEKKEERRKGLGWVGIGRGGKGKREVCVNNIPLSFDYRKKRSGETSFIFTKGHPL